MNKGYFPVYEAEKPDRKYFYLFSFMLFYAIICAVI